MDPNALLNELRFLVDEIKEKVSMGEALTLAEAAEELAFHFEELDTWLSDRNGFLPDDWAGR